MGEPVHRQGAQNVRRNPDCRNGAFIARACSSRKRRNKRCVVAVDFGGLRGRLGNTPAVARASYIGPAVIEQYMDGRTIEDFPAATSTRGRRTELSLDPEEQSLVSLLRLVADTSCTGCGLIFPLTTRIDFGYSLQKGRAQLARKTVLICDNCSKEVGEGKGATLRLTSADPRRGAKQADSCDTCATDMPGHPATRG